MLTETHILWLAFIGFVGVMLALDLGVFHRDAHEVSIKEALTWSAVWIAMALIFNGAIFLYWDRFFGAVSGTNEYTNGEAGMAFLAGYVVEKALSVDNIFVILMIFSYFQIPRIYQHRVLFYGIIGALVFRAIFIAVGKVVLDQFFWTTIIFGLLLIGTGIKMAMVEEHGIHPEKNIVLKAFKKLFPVSTTYEGQHFFVRKDGVKYATPLLVALVMVEATDVLFAVDSIPAIFAITSNTFIVFTSNVFALLGLRSLFFALDGLVQLFHYLRHGLAVILVFVGGKMIYHYIEKSVVPDWGTFPVGWSLLVILVVLGISIAASVMFPPQKKA